MNTDEDIYCKSVKIGYPNDINYVSNINTYAN